MELISFPPADAAELPAIDDGPHHISRVLQEWVLENRAVLTPPSRSRLPSSSALPASDGRMPFDAPAVLVW